MPNIKKRNKFYDGDIVQIMEDGYKEMGMLNVSLSEEGLSVDRENLESYEKYLVESE